MTKSSNPRRVVIVGGGFTGMTAAHDLARKGADVVVLEADEELGGLARGFWVGDTRLESFYHHWFSSDRHIMGLIDRLGQSGRVKIRPTVTGMYFAQNHYRLTTPLDLFRLSPLSWANRLRLGLLIIKARRHRDWRELDSVSAAEWLRQLAGPEVYRVVWEPLLKGKFGDYAEEISAAWFWSKLALRGGSRGRGGHENLLYFQGGFAALTDRIADDIIAHGGRIERSSLVTGIVVEGGRVTGVETTKGEIGCDSLGIVVAGHSGVLAEMAGFRLPIESVALQALVSEPIKPCMDVVVMANTVHGYMSQSDKGEMVIGGGADGYNNYTQRGSFHHIEETVRALVETFPMISRLKMLRQWGGIVDMTGDRSPIISKTPLGGCYINCGWGTGGFKAIPGSGWAMAEMMAKGAPGALCAEFGMDRFREGRFIDESVAAGVAH